MAYDEMLAQRIREMLIQETDVLEKKMMGGLCFMVNGKMCVGVVRDELMARIAPESREIAFQHRACREMDFTGKPLKNFIFVGSEGIARHEDLRFWIDLALAFNPFAQASKKRA